MSDVTFGLGYSTPVLGALIDPIDYTVRFERAGYGSLFIPDLEVSPALDPMVLIAAIAQRTTRMQLGVGVLALPFRHPFQLAKTALSVSDVSGGRFVLGVGAGQFKKDFDAEEVDMRTRGRMTDERLDLLRRLLDGDSVTYDGEFHHLVEVSVVRPISDPPAPPIWIGATWNDGIAQKALERTAKWADGFYPHDTPAAGYKETRSQLDAMAESAGRDPSKIESACFFWMGMGESKAAAQEQAQKSLVTRYGKDAWEVKPNNGYLLGSPDEVAETVQQYIDAGVTHFVLNSVALPERVLDDFERFASDVITQFN